MNLNNSGVRITKSSLIVKYKIVLTIIVVYFAFIYGIDFIISKESIYAHKSPTQQNTEWFILKNKKCISLSEIDPMVLTPNEWAEKYGCNIAEKQSLYNSTEENYFNLKCQPKFRIEFIMIKNFDTCNKVYEPKINEGSLN